MTQATEDVWDVLSTARAIRRFMDEPVDEATASIVTAHPSNSRG